MRAKAARKQILEYLQSRNITVDISNRELADLANYGALPGVLFDTKSQRWDFVDKDIVAISQVVALWKKSGEKMRDRFDKSKRRFSKSNGTANATTM